MILIEEFEKYGVDVIFLNCDKSDDNPESHLLLQMQGMIAEYERSKIMERNRRGRIYAAKRGSVNVLNRAPYGYRYIDKHTGQGEAAYGKNTTGTRLFHVRARKGSSEQPRNNVSRYRVEKENWIYIPVPAIIDNNLFDAVQEQIAENKKRARSRKTGATYLLQGLLVYILWSSLLWFENIKTLQKR